MPSPSRPRPRGRRRPAHRSRRRRWRSRGTWRTGARSLPCDARGGWPARHRRRRRDSALAATPVGRAGTARADRAHADRRPRCARSDRASPHTCDPTQATVRRRPRALRSRRVRRGRCSTLRICSSGFSDPPSRVSSTSAPASIRFRLTRHWCCLLVGHHPYAPADVGDALGVEAVFSVEFDPRAATVAVDRQHRPVAPKECTYALGVVLCRVRPFAHTAGWCRDGRLARRRDGGPACPARGRDGTERPRPPLRARRRTQTPCPTTNGCSRVS